MSDYTATMIVEGVEQPDGPMEYLDAVAHLIRTGLAWSLQGFFGRTCSEFINAGCVSQSGEVLIDEETAFNLFSN